MNKFALILITFCFVLSACSNDDNTLIGGNWPPMEWEEFSYKTQNVDNAKFIFVPKEGGTYTFVCKNYKSYWCTPYNRYFALREKFDYEEELAYHGENTYTNAKVNGHTLTVTFAANDTITRYCYLEVSAGDTFSSFSFMQEGAK
ncbi:MAG: hypothetical protein MJZ63_03350 [Muribaculaceae bacterium]|nr:hypothetical protein [Muribaculaceae bacterium]